MMQRKFIFGCLAGLLFMAFTAVNVTVSKSYLGNERGNQFSLVQLAAKAQSGAECFYVENGVPVVSCGSDDGCCWYRDIFGECSFSGSPTDYCTIYFWTR